MIMSSFGFRTLKQSPQQTSWRQNRASASLPHQADTCWTSPFAASGHPDAYHAHPVTTCLMQGDTDTPPRCARRPSQNPSHSPPATWARASPHELLLTDAQLDTGCQRRTVMSTAARSADAPGSHAVFMRSMSNASHTAWARRRRSQLWIEAHVMALGHIQPFLSQAPYGPAKNSSTYFALCLTPR